MPGKGAQYTDNVPKYLQRKIDSWRRNGAHIALTEKESRRALKACCVVDERGCWIWQLNVWDNGYGRTPCRLERAMGELAKGGRVHIIAYRLWRGAVPQSKMVCHTCDIERCMNPRHLWLGTNQLNQLDAKLKGRWVDYWTSERREYARRANSGSNNPMHGKKGRLAPCWGRRGPLHPMFGLHHTEAAREKISRGLRRYRSGVEHD